MPILKSTFNSFCENVYDEWDFVLDFSLAQMIGIQAKFQVKNFGETELVTGDQVSTWACA